jgi:two-component system sporulation sensor kinase B
LIFKYGGNKEIILFLNIPVVIAYLKKKSILALILSIIIIYNINGIYNINIYLIILKYIIFFAIYFNYQKKKYSEYKFITLISVIEAFFLSFEYFCINPINSLLIVLEIFVVSYIFYLIPFFILCLFRVVDKITDLYASSLEMEKDKQLKNSLFKITHEVKNPIAVCKGYLDMINPEDIYKVKKYLPIIKDEINRSLNIMTDFMEFSKIKLDKDILDINMLVGEVSDEMKMICRNKINISYSGSDEEIYINGDYCRMKQVLINMIKNSIEAIQDKGNIKIDTYVKSKNYYIEIQDDGIGMDKETLSKICDMFFTTKVRGSGLGVCLSNEIIKAHNGNIKYESTLNKGTKVIIKLPIYSC